MSATTILIVDDETIARNGLEKLLCGEGFAVVTAGSGVEAIAAARREHPDIVVTDLKMPDMDGVELCARLRDSDPDLPVILATGFQDVESSVRAMRAGAQDYLIKPLQFDALLIVIERAIERRAQKLQSEHHRATCERLYEEAVAAIRLRDEVLSTVSHELKNLVCTAHLGAFQLGKSAGNETAVHQLGDLLVRTTQSMSLIIQDLLDQSRVDRGGVTLDRSLHEVNVLLGDAMDLRPLALQKSIQLEIVMSKQKCALTCDRARIAQVLSNLVGNAIKFTPSEGTITVWASPTEEGVRFAVRDSGRGMAPETLPDIFERFWQQDRRSRSGLGLGLYIARGIVEAHGGRIWAESVLGVGSTLFFEIPFAGPVARLAPEPVGLA